MAITVEPGQQIRREGILTSIEYLTQSTTTEPQTLSLTTEISVLGGGTATGTNHLNLYNLPTGGLEGQEKLITLGASATTATGGAITVGAATGEASVLVPMATGRVPLVIDSQTATSFVTNFSSATGRLVLQTDGDLVLARYLNGLWRLTYLAGATWATAT